MAINQNTKGRGRKPASSSSKPDYRKNKGGAKAPRKGPTPQKWFKAVCGGCGKTCEVPFEPKGNKPVLCDRCYNIGEGKSTRTNHRAPKTASGTPMGDLPGRRGRDPRGGFNKGTEAELKEINRKLDRIMKAMGLKE